MSRQQRRRAEREGVRWDGGDRRRRVLLAITGLSAFVALALAFWYVSSSRPATSPQAAPTASALAAGAASRLAADGLPPLPPARLLRPREQTEEAYEFAARHPEVLRYVPCFCGCERQGHRSNLDCFVARRAKTGEVTWSAHGMG